MQSKYLVTYKKGEYMEMKEYDDHKEAYDHYHTLVFKLRKGLNEGEEGEVSSTDGYNRIFTCKDGEVYCERMKEIFI